VLIGVLALMPPLLWLILGVAALLGFVVQGAQSGLNALVAGFYSTPIRATGIGWALGIGRIGSIVGPLPGGLMLSLVLAAASHLPGRHGTRHLCGRRNPGRLGAWHERRDFALCGTAPPPRGPSTASANLGRIWIGRCRRPLDPREGEAWLASWVVRAGDDPGPHEGTACG
jgi:MFS family permease